MGHESHRSNDAPGDIDLALVAAVAGGFCALAVCHVVEVMRVLPIEPLGGAPPFVMGMAVIRGSPTPVVHLAKLLGWRHDRASVAHFVTVRLGLQRVALAVDGVLGVRSLREAQLQALPPLLEGACAEHTEALGILDARLLVVLRTARLVPPEVWNTLAARSGASPR